ncbi:MAG: hybrid sensor histidine kinase/response regulator [Proteobacteria bacterium]|nr:hybrid sensor histidine kinase/response regulator [Pseudomonadota bacterium]MBU1451525.1 hybrid sensor histidine kinase/response regulator [Pseudomonadota bacterium]MBU2469782.1 hybrid sensor histidine kinase/response regulator [Pseudomonadota bacterium]MBU2518772.1 hybrid sensor histidine kinase/response regulator [Pseudomonadota bacterium]
MKACGQPPYPNLLVIDDEPGIRSMMSLSLGADGYKVRTAADGAEGLKLFKEQQPDIVLTDIKMPGLDGIEVLKRIKSMSPDTEVIVITGHGDMDLAVRSLQLMASDFVTKPVSDQALEVALKRAAERLTLKAQLASYTHDLERRVAEATAKVVAAERLAAVGQTVSALVHSLKNMLAGLKGGIYMVGQGMERCQKQLTDEGMRMLERNLVRVQDLVGDMMTIAKPRQPQMEPVSLKELLTEAQRIMAAEAEGKGVEIKVEYPEGEGPVALADRRMILEAFLNLVSNGIDAAAEVEGGEVVLSTAGNFRGVCLMVRDNGPGLEPEAAQNIFQGFYSTKGAAGTGLGLMVAQKTAGEHGGRVDFVNLPDQGAMFRLRLPAAEQSAGQETQEVAAGEPRGSAG